MRSKSLCWQQSLVEKVSKTSEEEKDALGCFSSSDKIPSAAAPVVNSKLTEEMGLKKVAILESVSGDQRNNNSESDFICQTASLSDSLVVNYI